MLGSALVGRSSCKKMRIHIHDNIVIIMEARRCVFPLQVSHSLTYGFVQVATFSARRFGSNKY